MTDPFQRLADAEPQFIEIVARTLEDRAQDPSMLPIIDGYLASIDWPEVKLAIEVGSGTGPVTRMMAKRAPHARCVGFEPSSGLVERAKDLADGLANLSFAVADGAALPLKDGAADVVVMHTVLSHVQDPDALLEEAARVLRPAGTLVVCDADFSKTSLGNAPGDPVQAVAEYFVANFVTDAHLVPRLRSLAAAHGFQTADFRVTTRLVSQTTHMRPWFVMGGDQMVERGLIGRPLADALLAEHDRRLREGLLYGFGAFGTLTARKPE